MNVLGRVWICWGGCGYVVEDVDVLGRACVCV